MFIPFRNIREQLACRIVSICLKSFKDTDLIFLPLRGASYGNSRIKDCEDLGPPGSCRVKGTALDERLDCPLVDLSQVNPLAEVKYRAIFAAFISCFNYRFYGRFTQVLYSD